jgi:antitoxin Phd
MRELQLRDVKINLPAVVDDAVRGEGAVIARHGKPQAVIFGFAEWQRLSTVPSFARLLMSAPEGIHNLPARDESPIREVDF